MLDNDVTAETKELPVQKFQVYINYRRADHCRDRLAALTRSKPLVRREPASSFYSQSNTPKLAEQTLHFDVHRLSPMTIAVHCQSSCLGSILYVAATIAPTAH